MMSQSDWGLKFKVLGKHWAQKLSKYWYHVLRHVKFNHALLSVPLVNLVNISKHYFVLSFHIWWNRVFFHVFHVTLKYMQLIR